MDNVTIPYSPDDTARPEKCFADVGRVSCDTDYKDITQMPNNCFFGVVVTVGREQRSLFSPPPQLCEFTRAHSSGSH